MRPIVTALISISVLGAALICNAQGPTHGAQGGPGAVRGPGGPGGGGRRMSPEDRVKNLKKEIPSLSADQEKKLLAVFKGQSAKMEKMRASMGGGKPAAGGKPPAGGPPPGGPGGPGGMMGRPSPEMMAAFKKMREDTTAEMKKIMKPDQFKKYEEIQAKRRQGGRGGPGAGGPGAPPGKRGG